MLRALAATVAVVAASAFAASVGLYALLVLGCRRGIESYYG
jgi:hypothetical protein